VYKLMQIKGGEFEEEGNRWRRMSDLKRGIGEPDYVWQGAQDIANDMAARGYAEWQAAGG
jgi:hypothetical protein